MAMRTEISRWRDAARVSSRARQIGACDQEHASGRDHQYEQPDARIPQQFFLNADDDGAHPPVFQEFRGHCGGHLTHVSSGTFHGYTRSQSSDHIEKMGAPVLQIGGAQRQRHPIGNVAPLQGKVTRQDSDHTDVTSVQPDLFPDNIGVLCVALPPQTVTDHRHRRSLALLFHGEGSAQNWPHAQYGKEVCSDPPAENLLRSGIARQTCRNGADGSHIGKHMVTLLPFTEVAWSRPVLAQSDETAVFPQHHHTMRLSIRQGSQQRAICRGKNGGIDPYSKGQRDQSDRRKSRSAAEHPQGIADVLQ